MAVTKSTTTSKTPAYETKAGGRYKVKSKFKGNGCPVPRCGTGRYKFKGNVKRAQARLPAYRRQAYVTYSIQRLKSRDALVPPKPKEFERA